MPETYKNRLVAGLLAFGYTRDASDRSKYEAFTHADKPGRKFFVGPNGALRVGECASRSYSISDATNQGPSYRKLLVAGDSKLAGLDPRNEYA